MHVSVSDAKASLTDLIRRAEAGDEIVLTRRGKPAVRLVPISDQDLGERRRKTLDGVLAMARATPSDGEAEAARSQDWLYDDRGLPA